MALSPRNGIIIACVLIIPLCGFGWWYVRRFVKKQCMLMEELRDIARAAAVEGGAEEGENGSGSSHGVGRTLPGARDGVATGEWKTDLEGSRGIQSEPASSQANKGGSPQTVQVPAAGGVTNESEDPPTIGAPQSQDQPTTVEQGIQDASGDSRIIDRS